MVPHEKTFATLDVIQSYKLLIAHVSALRERHQFCNWRKNC